MSIKKRIFDIIQIGNKEDIPSRVFDYFISCVIIVNILSMFLETFKELSACLFYFKACENITVLIFCIEYFLRIWTADLLYPRKSKLRARLRFLRSYDGIVDFFTILPFFFFSGFIVFRMLRVVRILHLFRLNSQYDSFNVITTVLREKKNQIFSSLFIVLILMFASSLGIYNAEHKVQPDVFKNAFSGIWWSMSTLLTVGYGDIFPVTVSGRIMAIMTAFLGVGAVAIPTGIISAGFVELYSKKEHNEPVLDDIEKFGEIMIKKDSELLGSSIKQLYDIYGIKVLIIYRDGLSILPSENIKAAENDILIISSDKIHINKKQEHQKTNHKRTQKNHLK